MSIEIKKEIQLEIAHVLFIDIVGYSKFSINEQHTAVEELNQIVRASAQFSTAVDRALVALGDNPCWVDGPVILSRTFGEGLLGRMMKDEARAQAAFSKARLEQEKIVQAQADYGPPLCVLGLIDAALGRKEDALREGRRAIELLPVEKDSLTGSQMLVYFAVIAAGVGEKDLALQYLAANGQSVGGGFVATYGALKLMPFWDPLRGDPRFEKIVEEAKRPVALK